MRLGTVVFKDEDKGNILRRGVVVESDDVSMVRVEWDHMLGYHVWEDISEVYTCC